MRNYFDILRVCPLFRDIAPQELTRVLECLDAKIYSFDKGEAVFNEGDPANDIGVVLTGRLQIVRTDFFVNRSIIASLGPRELFGESFACADVKSIPVDVVAAEDSEVLLIDCLRITHSCSSACEFHQQLIYNLLKIVATKNLAFHQKTEITSRRTTQEKLMAYLLLQAKKNNSTFFEIPYNRQELADYLGVERSGLSVSISRLCRQGVIEADKKKFRILRKTEE